MLFQIFTWQEWLKQNFDTSKILKIFDNFYERNNVKS